MNRFAKLPMNNTKFGLFKSYSYITLRMDDICPQMNYQNFLRFKSIFDKYGIKPLLGVIPDNLDPSLYVGEEISDFWDLMKELKNDGWSIAQHGHNHVYTTNKSGLFSLNKRSEFAGLAYEEQLRKIKLGRDIMNRNGVETNIFMAPGHSIDKNTLRAIKEIGFCYVSDGRSKYPYVYQNLKFIPCRDHQFKKKKGLITICIHSNSVSNAQLDELEAFIVKNRSNIIDFSYAMTFPVVPYFVARLDELINIYFLKYVKPILYPVYRCIKVLVSR